MSTQSPSSERYRELLARQLAGRPDRGPEWLEAYRAAAAQRLDQLEMPERRQEAWRYTSIEPLLQPELEPVSEPEVPPTLAEIGALLLPETEGIRLVLVNGRYAPGLSNLSRAGSAEVQSLGEALRARGGEAARLLGSLAGPGDHAFGALNAALAQDGALVRIPRDVSAEHPIEVLHLAVPSKGGQVAQPRHLVIVEPGARAVLVERFLALGSPLYFNNLVCEVLVGQSAQLIHQRLQAESPNALHLSQLHIRLEEGSQYRGLTVALGAAWSRTELKVRFGAPGGECLLDGLYVAGDRQLVDVHLDVDHAVPGCASRTRFRGILDGQGRAVLDGRVLVRKHAQKTNAHLSNANLMLSRGAEIDTKPQLEIFADDVQCGHGTTVGQLDPDAMFYLRARGLGETEARRMLSLGFAAEVLDCVSVAGLRDQAVALLEQRLDRSPRARGEEVE